MRLRSLLVSLSFSAVAAVAAVSGCGGEPPIEPTGDGGTRTDGGVQMTQDAGMNVPDAGMTVDSGTPVSFAMDVVPLFASNGCTGCHAGAGSGGLSLTGTASDVHARLVNVPANNQTCSTLDRVEPSEPANSFLYLKVSANVPNGCGNPMPPNSGLTSDKSDIIRDWIAQGAPNN